MGWEDRNPAKISRPIFRKILLRKRLFSILDGEPEDRLVWVSGIAGSGKTTLVSSYIQERKRPCIWYQLDSSDEDPAIFFHYLQRALEGQPSKAQDHLPGFIAGYCPDITAFTHRYFETFFSNVDPDTLIVFDSYPDVPDTFIMNLIPDALSHVPVGVKVVVISRRLPPPNMSVVRVHRIMKEVRTEDLRLDPVEFRDAVQVYGIKGLSQDTLDRMHRGLEGWISGLMLMVESVRRSKLDLEKVSGIDIQEIYDFFVGEIEKNLDEETMEFLLRTSLLPDMTAESARSLTGYDRSEKILNYLYSRNFFVSRHGQEPPVYQYHTLFREYLQRRAGTILSAHQLDSVKRQAAHHLWKADQIEKAASLLSQIGDWEELTGIILARAGKIVQQGRFQTLERLIRTIPEDRQRRNHRILYWKGICRLPFNPGESMSYLMQSLKLATEAGDARKAYLSWAAVVESVVFQLNRHSDLDHMIDDFERLRCIFPEYPSRELETRVSYCVLLALLFRRIEHPDIAHWEHMSLALAHEYGSWEDRVMAAVANALLQFFRGHMMDMKTVIESHLEPYARSDLCPHLQPLIHYLIGIKEWMRGNMEQSVEIIANGLEIADRTGIHTWDLLLLGQEAVSCVSDGDLSLTASYLEKMKKRLPGASKHERSHYHYISSWEAISRDDLPLARSHLKTAVELKKEVGNPIGVAINILALAEVEHDLGRKQRASKLMADFREITERTKSKYLTYLGELLDARFSLDDGDEERAAANLERALTIGADNGIISYYWMRRDHLTRLCCLAMKRNIKIPHVQEMIRKHKLTPIEPLMEEERWPWPVKIYTLGRLELLVHEEKIQFARKAQERPMDLLKAILAFGGRKVASESLVEALWPDSDGAAGQQALATTLHRLRHLIQVRDAVIFSQGEISLNPELCWVDVWAVERAMGKIKPHLEDALPDEQVCSEKVLEIERTLEHYRGHFMASDGHAPWTIAPRERLRSKFIRALKNYCDHLEKRGEDERAVHWYLKALELESLSEELYQGLILSYLRLGRKANAMATYNRCRDTLSMVLGVAPSPETEALRDRISR